MHVVSKYGLRCGWSEVSGDFDYLYKNVTIEISVISRHFPTNRRNLYIWSIKNGELIKILDAHFGRIISLEPLTIANWNSVLYRALRTIIVSGNINFFNCFVFQGYNVIYRSFGESLEYKQYFRASSFD